MESIPQIAGELVEHLDHFNDWEEAVNNLSQRIAGEVGTMVMRAMDDALFEQKGKGLIVVGRRKRTITTRFGSLQIERRLYRDAEGNHRFLLDEAMGLEPSSGKALRAVGKTVQAGFAATEEFWQAFSVSLASTYDLGGVGEVVLGGDGASWVRGGSKLFPVKRFQLCRFHLKRALRTALGPDHDKVRLAYKAACKGDHEGADGILAEAESAATDERKEQIAGTRRYLAANRGCLADWRTDEQREEGVRGLGAMEGNIDKLLANRFKKRGMSWSVRGGDSMAKVIQLRQNGELEGWVQGARQRQDQDTLIAPAVEKLKKRLKEDPAGWLDAHMPALDGPHSDRPWVLMLKEMARIENVA